MCVCACVCVCVCVWHNQVAGIVYRKICTEYGLDPPKSRWNTPQKVVVKNRAKLLWDVQIQTDRKVLAN